MNKNNLNIKSWSAQDRPREKLQNKGRSALSDAEHIAILLRSGSKNTTAVDLAKQILNSVDNNLMELGKLDISELIKFKGMGEAKAITLVSALELGRRRSFSEGKKKSQITSSQEAFEYMAPYLLDLPNEEFWIAMLNRGNFILDKKQISSGGVAGTVVDLRIIFKYAIEQLASSIILYHNHPSGNLKPSKSDIDLTKKIKHAGNLLDVTVLDHLIVSGKAYFSFADEGLL